VDTEDLSLAEKDDMEEDSKEFRNLNFPAKAHSLSSPTQEAWSFIEKLLHTALPLLKPETGRFYTHCNGINVPTLLRKYEDMLDKFVVTKTVPGSNCNQKFKLKWTQRQTFVPSFMEVWVFYQVKLASCDDLVKIKLRIG